MGRPKAWLPWDGETLLQRVVRVVSTEVQPVVLATRRGTALPEIPGEVEFAFDRAGDTGPLAGIAAGFDALAGRCDAVFVVPCDHPLIRVEYIRRLIELLEDYPAVVPRYQGRLNPLTAVYRLSTQQCLVRLLRKRQWRAGQFAESIDARIITPLDLADADPNLDSLRNLNDSPDYHAHVLRHQPLSPKDHDAPNTRT